MSEKASMRRLVEAVAGPRTWSDTRQSWLNRAARRSGLSFRTIKGIWYGEITDESHAAIRILRRTAADTSPEILAQRLEALARGMVAADADFYRPDIRALIDAVRALRNLDRPGNDQT